MEEAGTPASWFYERLSYDERREVRDPDETLENYCLMLNQYVSELRRRPPDRDDPSTQGFFRWMAGIDRTTSKLLMPAWYCPCHR